MWGMSPRCFSLRDTGAGGGSVMECHGLWTQMHSGLSYHASCRASCSVVSGEAVVVRSSSCRGNFTHGLPREHGCARIGYARVAAQKTSRLEAVGGEDSEVRVGDGEEVRGQIVQDWAALNLSGVSQVSEGNGREGVDPVEVTVEKTGSNMRRIIAKISVGASLEDVWAILTDYERLADFIPGLAVSQLLERRYNGCRLYQVGEQHLAFGVKFKAKAVVDCEEKPCEVEPNVVRRDIDFNTVEGDFQIFKGTWRMEQVGGQSTFVAEEVGGLHEYKTFLYYILDVQPKIWLPVALVEGILTSEIKINLLSIRDKAQESLAV